MNKVKKFLLTTLTIASLAAVAVGVSACDSDSQDVHTCQWGNWTVATAPTDTTEGKATRTCSGEGDCDAPDTDKEYTLPVLTSTDYSKGADSATCTEEGSVTYSYNKDGVSVSFAVTTDSKGHGTLESHEAKAVNCLVDGYEAYWECPDCGWLFSDEDGTDKIDEPVVITAKGSHGELTYHAAATVEGCTEPGTKAYYECPDCGWLFSDEDGTDKIDEPVTANHPNAVKTEAVAATCTSGGKAAYWTCPDCGKHFADEDYTQEVTDLDNLNTDVLAHKLTFVEGEGATCYSIGYKDCWECGTCEKLFSDEEGTTEIAARVTIPKHPAAKEDSKIASKSVAGISFSAFTKVYCGDCENFVKETKSSGVVTAREEVTSDLIYYKASYYCLFYDASGTVIGAGVTATVDMAGNSLASSMQGISFVAPETGIYTFTFGGGVSISTVSLRQSSTNYTVYDNNAWINIGQKVYFDTSTDTLTNTITFEVEKNEMVTIKLSSASFTAVYTYEKCYEVHFNRPYMVEPTTTDRTAQLVADVPEAGDYLVTVVGTDFDSSATFTVQTSTDTQTDKSSMPMTIALSPKMPFSVTCNGAMSDGIKASYKVTITKIKGTLDIGENDVAVTVANSDLYVDAYTFTASTADSYTFKAPAGLTVKIVEKSITVSAGSQGIANLAENETVTVVLKGSVNNAYKLNITVGASYDPVPSGAFNWTTDVVYTFKAPDTAGNYKITVGGTAMTAFMGKYPIYFALNQANKSAAEIAGPSGNNGDADVIYGSTNNFWKSGDGTKIKNCTGGVNKSFSFEIYGLQPTDTLSFLTRVAGGLTNISITVVAI